MTVEAANIVINGVADKLAVPADQLLELLPRLGFKFVGSVIIEFIGLIIVAGILAMFLRFLSMHNCNDSVDVVGVIFLIALAMMAIGLAISLVIDSAHLVFWLHDPSAWALDYILERVR